MASEGTTAAIGAATPTPSSSSAAAFMDRPLLTLTPAQVVRSNSTSTNNNNNNMTISGKQPRRRNNHKNKKQQTRAAATDQVGTGTDNDTATTDNSPDKGEESLPPKSGKNSNQPNKRRPRNNNNRSNNQSKNQAEADSPQLQPSEEQISPTKGSNNNNNNNKNHKKKSGNKNNTRENNNNNNNNNTGSDNQSNHTNNNARKGNNINNNNNNNNRRNKPRKRFPWRKHIPVGTVDPITLESLVSLPYPPFALRSSPPYLPVPVWPPPEQGDNNHDSTNNNTTTTQKINRNNEAAARERERQLLLEQWGNVISTPQGLGGATIMDNNQDAAATLSETTRVVDQGAPVAAAAGDVNININININPSHINLFDGRALAYYMVSQLQFIDPLTRRDLSREELIQLDRYLVRNEFTDLNVVEAYDTKGVSISTAGATAATAAGRMEILQQEARVLLHALFGRGSSVLPSATTTTTTQSNNTSGRSRNNNNNNNNNNFNQNALQQQYSNYQAAQEQQVRYSSQYMSSNGGSNYSNDNAFLSEEDMGVYGDEAGGMVVIDDDLNPSLRGGRGLRPFRAAPATNRMETNSTLWSAARITSQHGQSQAPGNLQEDNFPALSATTTTTTTSTAAGAPTVRTTTDQSSLHASAPAFVPGSSQAPPSAKATRKNLPPANTLKIITKAVKKTTPEEAQRQFEAREEARRKALLSNLTFGANPPGWDAADAKPSSLHFPASYIPTEGQLERNRAFADALGVAAAPGAASRLQGWARPTSAGQHTNFTTYPDALILSARENMGALLKLERKWKTFLVDDKAASLPLNKMERPMRKFVHEYSDYWKLHTESFDPEPKRYIHCVKLLDTAAPYPLLSDAAREWRGPSGTVPSSEHAFHQTAGQDTSGGEILFGQRIDLPKAPRAVLEPMQQPSNPRAAALVSERLKLELKERTLPLEMPPFQPPVRVPEVDDEESARRRQARLEEQKRRAQEREELKQKTLAAAFASDSEEESLAEVDADSDWEEGEALYNGSDEEG